MGKQKRERGWLRAREAALLTLLVLLTACATAAPTSEPTAVPLPAAAKPSPTDTPLPGAANLPLVSTGGRREFQVTDEAGYVNTFYIDPLLENPTPRQGEYVLVRPRLFKNGYWRVAAMPIVVEWGQGGRDQSCEFMPFYLMGCTIRAEGFAPGVPVPITVTIHYDSNVFVDYASFTPR